MRYIISGLDGNVGKLIKKMAIEYINYSNDIDVKGNEVFLHLASRSYGSYQDIINANIDYLCEVIEFCKSNNISKFVFFSACSIYNKDDIYSVSKLLGEKILKESKMKILILRLPMILTSDKKYGILNRIIHKLEKDDDVELYNAHRVFNNFISVDEIYNFIELYPFLNDCETIDLVSNDQNSLLDITEMLKEIMGSKSNIVELKKLESDINLSINNIIDKYGYLPLKNSDKLKRWINLRNKNE